MNYVNKITLLSIGSIVLGTILTFVGVWFVAPEVGGAWWPYIRFIVSLGAAIVVGKILMVLVSIVNLFLSTRQIFQMGSEEEAWDDKNINEFFDDDF